MLAPVVRAQGRGLVVHWDVPLQCPSSVSWHLRVRQVATDKWRSVDIEAGRIAQDGELPCWRHKALLVAPGVNVLAYYYMQGNRKKSHRPAIGTIVMIYPGAVAVDFYKTVVARSNPKACQVIPCEWVLQATTSSDAEMRKPAASLEAVVNKLKTESRAKKLWGLVRAEVYHAILLDSWRRNAQRALLWERQTEKQEVGARVGIDCSLTVMTDAAVEKPTLSPPTTVTRLSSNKMKSARTFGIAVQAVPRLDRFVSGRSRSNIFASPVTEVGLERQMVPSSWWPAVVKEVKERPLAHCSESFFRADDGLIEPPAKLDEDSLYAREESTGSIEKLSPQGKHVRGGKAAAITQAASTSSQSWASRGGSKGELGHREDGRPGSRSRGERSAAPSGPSQESLLQLNRRYLECSKLIEPSGCEAGEKVALHLEPLVRTQIIPREWLYVGSEDARRAAGQACIGQRVLAYYDAAAQEGEHEDEGDAAAAAVPLADGMMDLTLRGASAGVLNSTGQPPDAGTRELQCSERAIRGRIVKEYVDPNQVMVACTFDETGGSRPKRLKRVPLSVLCGIPPQEGCTTQRTIQAVAVSSTDGGDSYIISAVLQLDPLKGTPEKPELDDVLELRPGMKVLGPGDLVGKRKSKLIHLVIDKIMIDITHLKVEFEDVVPEELTMQCHSLAYRWQVGGVRRGATPCLLIRDIPKDLTAVEISVGVESSVPSVCRDKIIRWSSPCKVCEIPTPERFAIQPLPPSVSSDGTFKALVHLLSLKEPETLSFELRMRPTQGSRMWKWISPTSAGSMLAAETDMNSIHGWQAHWIPLQPGQWVSVYDSQQGRTGSLATGKVVSLGEQTLQVAFAPSVSEVRLGHPASAAGSSNSKQDAAAANHSEWLDEPKDVPYECIEAVWATDGSKGVPLRSYEDQNIILSEVTRDPLQYCIRLEGSENALPNILADGRWVACTRAVSMGGSSSGASIKLGTVTIEKLQPEADYELQMRILTADGWSDYSQIQAWTVPRIEYEKDQLVEEKMGNVFYKADLLPNAFFKDQARCWQTIQEALDAKRLDRLKQLISRGHGVMEGNNYDEDLSKSLVDLDGPIRQGRLMTAKQVLPILEDLVERKANLNHRDQVTGRTPLTYACEYGLSHEVIDGLLVLRADVDSCTDDRRSSLAIAAAGGHLQIVECLLSHGADPTIVSFRGDTALTSAQVQDGMYPETIEGLKQCRKLLCEGRIAWEDFMEAAQVSEDPEETAMRVIELAFPSGVEGMFASNPDGSRRIAKEDRLRLRDQIFDCDGDSEEVERRGRFSGNVLLKHFQAACAPSTSARWQHVAAFARYMLLSGVAHFCLPDLHAKAAAALDEFSQVNIGLHAELQKIGGLIEGGESFVGMAANWSPFNDRPLHQWHAHGDLPWLSEQNVVGAFEALVRSTSLASVAALCTWVGALNARMGNAFKFKPYQMGVWDPRLADLFWGDVYTRFLLGEAQRAAPMFHRIGSALVEGLSGASYKMAPLKHYSRVSKKQSDYTSAIFTAIHHSLDCMPGIFTAVLRVDQDNSKRGRAKSASNEKPAHFSPPKCHAEAWTEDPIPGAVLVLGEAIPERKLERIGHALSWATDWEGEARPVMVMIMTQSMDEDSKGELERKLGKMGAHSVVFQPHAKEDIPAVICSGVKVARRKFADAHRLRNVQPDELPPPIGKDLSSVLFEIRKMYTGATQDLLCAGGLLDYVRGSITCTTEDEVEEIFDRAMRLKISKDEAEVVRVKNSFHTPGAGGYCDLKLFMMVARDDVTTRLCHMGELQVHLKQFLDMKKFSHLPYVVHRGDHDHD